MGRRLKQVFMVAGAAAILLALGNAAAPLPSGSKVHLMAKASVTADPDIKSFDPPDAIVQTAGVILSRPVVLANLTASIRVPNMKNALESPWKNRAPPPLY